MKLLKRMFFNFANVICFFLLLIGVNGPQVYAQSIEIDANNLGPVVQDGMFGSNLVYVWNNFNQLDQIERQTDFSVIRFPGGSVTENEFDLTDPYKYLSHDNSGTVPDEKCIDRFIKEINQYDYTGVFVLPTIRYIGNEGLAKAQVRSYVANILDGEYGQIEKDRTIHFEIGNEFFWNQITGTEYAKVAVDVIKGIKQGISNSTTTLNYTVEISVQAGVTDQQAREVAAHFRNKAERHSIDYLTWHGYPGRTEIALGMRQLYSKTQLLRDRLQDIKDEWAVAQVNVPFFISEFNIKNSNDSGHDHGLRNPMGIMSIFAESVRANAKMATIWPLASGTTLKTRLYHDDDNDSNYTPTFNGIQYKWMESHLRGKRIINGVKNNTYSNNNDFRSNGAYVEAFVSNNEMVIFVHELESSQRQFRIDLDGFVVTSRKAEVMYTTVGREEDYLATPILGRRWPAVWNNGRNITFTSNKASKYEVIKIVLQGYRTNSKSAKLATESSVLPVKNFGVKIFPNPVSSDVVCIETEQDLGNVAVYNINGVLEIERNLDGGLTTDVDVSKLRPGIYIIRVETADGGVVARSVVKM